MSAAAPKRGARGGVGQRGGRGGPSPRGGGGNQPPLAAQMRQVQRLDEPKEMALFRRFKDLGLARVRSTYTPTGLVDQELLIPEQNVTPQWGDVDSLKGDVQGQHVVLTLLEAEDALASLHAAQQRERAVNRAPNRVGRSGSWGSFSPAEKEKLLLSNAEYSRRYPSTNVEGVPLGGASAAGTGSGDAGPSGTK